MLPEWNSADEKNRKIRFQDVMLALGKSDKEIAEAKEEYEQLDKLFSLNKV